MDVSDEKIQKKIARAFGDRYNFVLVVGQKEMESNSVNVRGRTLACYDKITDKPEKYTRVMTIDAFLDLCKEVAAQKLAM